MASPSLSNVTFPVFRSNLNDIIQSLDTVNAGTTAPTDYEAYTLWLDTNSPVTLKIRNAGNTAWVSVLTMTGEDVSGAGWFVDEDTMSSDSATKVPSQQSVKAYVDNTATTINSNIRTDEEIEDLAAAMLVNGTHDGISFAYDDVNGEIDATIENTGWVAGTATSLTGTSLTFSSIPSGTNHIKVLFFNASVNGYISLRLGDSGGIESSGYDGGYARIDVSNNSVDGFTTTTFFGITEDAGVSQNFFSGIHLTRISGNTWHCTAASYGEPNDRHFNTYGLKTLSGELTQVQLLSNASISGGTAQIYYQ